MLTIQNKYFILPIKHYNSYMNNINMKQNVLATIAMVAAISILSSLSTVQAEEINTNDFEFTIHITDVIPFYTWGGMSNFLTDSERSFEDIDTIRLIIQDTNYYAVYNNNVSDNTFEFAGIYENGA